MHTRTRMHQLVYLTLRDGTRLAWHFLRRRRTVLEFREGTIRRDALAQFVPLSRTKERKKR